MYRSHLAHIFPFTRAFDGGGGSGAGPAHVSGGDVTSHGGPSGRGSQIGSGSPSGAGGDSGNAAVRLSDEDLFDPGDGKPVKFGDWKKGYVPRGDLDSMSQRYSQGRDYLLSEAKRVEGAWTQLASVLRAQGHSQAGKGGPQDPIAKYKDLAVVDGNTLNEAYQALRDGDLKPMQQTLQQQQKVIESLMAQVKGLSGSVGSHNETNAEQSYQRSLESAIHNLNIPGLDLSSAEIKPHLDIVREIADDVYRSHDPNDPNYAREMPGILRTRMEGLLKLATAISKVKVTAAKDEKRRFMRPGGNASPSNGKPYQHENGRALARRFFDSMHADAS